MRREELDYGKDTVKGLFRKLFFPTLAGMLFNALFLITDGIFVGRGIGPDALAAIGLFEPLLVLFLGIGAMTGVGCSVRTSTRLSVNNTAGAIRCVTSSITAVILLTGAIAALIYATRDFTLDTLGSTPALHEMAAEYLVWFLPSCIMIAVQIVGSYAIRLDGSPRYTMYANIVPNILNIILDYLFIIRFGWGLKGAAIATDIGYIIGCMMTVMYLFRARTLKLDFSRKPESPLEIMKLGVPAFINEISAGVICLCGNLAFVKYLKETGLAAFGTICYLTPIIYSVFISVSSSMQPIVSYSHGCGNTPRIREAFRHAFKVTAGVSAAIAAAVFIFHGLIASVFLKPGIPAHETTSAGIMIYAAAYLFSGLNMTITTYYQSIEKLKYATFLTTLRGFVLPAAAFAVMPVFFGTAGLWLAVPATEACVFGLGLYLLIRKK